MARTLNVTQSQRREWAKLVKAVETARKAIWGHAPGTTHATWNECLWRATYAERKALEAAHDAESAFEARMIAEGRGWRSTLGVFMPHGVSLAARPTGEEAA